MKDDVIIVLSNGLNSGFRFFDMVYFSTHVRNKQKYSLKLEWGHSMGMPIDNIRTYIN